MRMDQRLRLFEIAERHNSWIIEDDFDGEYRFQGRPVPAIQSMDYAVFHDLFASELPADVTLSPAGAGIQLVADLPEGCDDRAVVEAYRLGVNASPLSKYYWSTSGNGLVLGYAACNKAQSEAGIRRLRQAIEQARTLC
ncbi:hypothetical protein ACFX5Q_33350 [Mesorhizobium sp. IMUNJ 23033]|uniref:hypothetical protein n=1 Tax=Mesorhizobium sp. IMUNJ 23033 TaxID=3378039 RepID=UPI00384DD612